MWGWLAVGIAVLAALFLLPPLLERVPRPKGTDGVGSALLVLAAAFRPTAVHVEQVKRELPADAENDDPKDPSPLVGEGGARDA